MLKLIFFLIIIIQVNLCYSLNDTSWETMSLEEKIGQLMIVYFEGVEANDHAKRLITDAYVGGFIYYEWANGLQIPQHVKILSGQLQQIAKDHQCQPLFIAIDQEGGRVQRLRNGFTNLPGNATLGLTEEPKLANAVGKVIGEELSAVGINLNFAPVVDINSNPNNPIIGSRSFGSNPNTVAQFGQAFMNGLQQEGVISCLKHFPGLGEAVVDPHKALPIVNKSIEDLYKIELVPYKALLQTASLVMTAHVLLPEIDYDKCATLSKKIIDGILRNDMGYNGVVITDSLTMKGVLTQTGTLTEAVIQAFEAGNDILLIGGRDLNEGVTGECHVDEIIEIHQSMIQAVKSGRITEERVNQSVKRILGLKRGLQD